MLKKIAFAAFAAAAMSAMAQSTDTNTTNQNRNGSDMNRSNNWSNSGQDQMNGRRNWSDGDMPDATWRQKYDTYAIGTTDVNSIPMSDQWRILKHALKGIPSTQAFVLNDFLMRSPGDQEMVLLKALVTNYKQASMVRDEVAQARFGNDQTYAWLSYPPLTWGSNPGENSWASINPDNVVVMVYNDNDGENAIAMNDESSRPMRMAMSHRAYHDIDYDRALGILDSGLNANERAVLHTTFHPMYNQPVSYNSEGGYTNEAVLDAAICLIQSNASMVNHLDRYSWYNHFDKSYYSRPDSW